MRILSLLVLLFTPIASSHLNGDDAVSYQRDVRPVFRKNCVGCHNRNRRQGDLDLSSYAGILAGANSGEVVRAGDPDDSLLYLVIAHQEEPAMPPEGQPLERQEQELVRRWIELGMPETSAVVEATSSNVNRKPNMEALNNRPADSNRDASAGSARNNSGLVLQSNLLNPITALAANEEFVARSGYRQIIIQDVGDGSLENVLPFPEGETFDLQFCGDGLLMAAGGEHSVSGQVVFWNIENGLRVAEFGDEFDTVLAAACSDDGKFVLLGGPERLLKAFDRTTGQPKYQIDKHTDWILDIAIDPQSLVFASADRAGNLFAWELESGKLIHTLRGHRGPITRIAWFPDGNRFVSAGEDGLVRVWNMHSGVLEKSWMADPEGITDLLVDPMNQISTIGRGDTATLWNQSGEAVRSFSVGGTMPTKLTQSKDRTVIGGWDGSVRMIDEQFQPTRMLPIPSDRTTRDPSKLQLSVHRSENFVRSLAYDPTKHHPVEAVSNNTPPNNMTRPSVLGPFAELDRILSQEKATFEQLRAGIRQAEEQLTRIRSAQQPVASAHKVQLQELLSDLTRHRDQLGSIPSDSQLQQLQLLIDLSIEKTKQAMNSDPAMLRYERIRANQFVWDRLANELSSAMQQPLISARHLKDNPWNSLQSRIANGQRECEELLKPEFSAMPDPDRSANSGTPKD